MSRTLTFDLGTSYFKACLWDESLRLVALHSLAVPVVAPLPGQRELPVNDFRSALTTVAQRLSHEVGGLGDVTKVCFASQANSFTLLDEGDVPQIPFLIWSDRRAEGCDVFLQEFSGNDDFYLSTGIPQLDRQFMVAKLHWLQGSSPALFERTRRICTVSDYFSWWLTGDYLAEAGLAGLTGLVDIHRMEYRPVALQQLNILVSQLPTIVRGGSDAGPIQPHLVEEWGLAPKCRLVMGCLDQYAGAIGAGITTAGGICETTGTVLATVRCTREFQRDAGAGVFQGPAFAPGLFFQMVFSSLSAGILERYRNCLPDMPSFAALDGLAEEVPAGAAGLVFNRDSILDDRIEVFIGRTPVHGRGHEVRAIMEAVAWELKGQVAALCGNDRPTSIVSVGGAARSRLWREIKREILGCEIKQVDSPEPTSLGAALLARGVGTT